MLRNNIGDESHSKESGSVPLTGFRLCQKNYIYNFCTPSDSRISWLLHTYLCSQAQNHFDDLSSLTLKKAQVKDKQNYFLALELNTRKSH